MEVSGKYFIVPKHIVRKGKKARRAFHGEEDMKLMTDLAGSYAGQNGEDFLIVQVVTEVSKPEKKGVSHVSQP